MTQEALKLAIQLRDTASGYWTENEIPIIEKLIEILAQPEQEPVAWRWQRLGQEWILEGSLKQTPIDAVIVEPLYTHPPQRTEQEPVADDFFKMIADKNPKPFPPPQRTWVGLTDEEMQDCLNGLPTQTIDVYARRIEAKLREKNT
jgi:hypothetical protein